MKKNNIPDEVAGYIAAMHSILTEDEEAKKDIFGNEYVDPKTFWQLFESQSMINWSKTGDPVLNADQFKDVQLSTIKLGLEESFKKLTSMGLIEEHEDGFKVTDEGIEAAKRAEKEK